MRPRHLFLLVVLAAALAATTAGAQTGQPFVPQQTWYLDAFGLGVATNTAADSLIVEFDGVPGLTAADHRHPMPPQLASITPASRNYRLSPSRRALYVFGTAADGSGTRIELFVIIPWNGSGLVPVAGTSLADGIAFDGFLDLSPQPMLFFAVSRANFASQQSIWWANLGDGATGTTSGLPAGIASPLTFAPTGIAAFVQHDGTFPGQSTYRLVELCSATLGTLISQTGWPFNDLPAPVAEAWLTDDGSGGPAAGVWRGGTLLGLVPLDDCTSTPPPPEPAVLDIATTAPGSVTAFGHVTYSVRVRNTGAGPSESVFLYVPVPAGAAFASASAGGNYDSLRNRVAYVLGALPPGYDATHTVTVATDCNSPQLFPAPAFLQIVNAVVATANSVSTTVQPLGSLPGLTITATPSAVPLPPGGTIDYTFTFAAPTTDQPDVVVYAGWGNFADLASFGATGGGVFQDNIGGFQWTGDLAAGVSTQFSIRVVLWECHGTYPSTTSLNHGYPVSYYGACGADAWTPVPAGIPMTPPDLAARIRVHGPQPVRTFPASAGVVDDFALVRPDEPFTVVWEVFNHGTQSHPACSATLDLAGLQPVGSPPFVGTPPPGVVWVNPGNDVLWTGALAPGDTMRVTLQLTLPADQGCRQDLACNVATTACLNYAGAWGHVYGVAPMRTDGHLLAASPGGPVTRMQPDLQNQFEDWICLNAEYVNNFTVNDAGVMWLSGLPTRRIDPSTLALWQFDYAQLDSLGLSTLWGAVEDTNGDIYLATALPVGNENRVSLVRWDPDTDATTLVWQEQTGAVGDISGIIELDLAPEGTLMFTAPEGVVSMDLRNDPAGAVMWSDPMITGGYHAFARLSNGAPLVVDPVWGTGTEVMAMINTHDGSHIVVVPDLNAAPGAEIAPWTSMAFDDAGRVYLAPGYGNLAVVDIGAPSPLPMTASFGPIACAGLAWRKPTSGVGAVGDGDAVPPLALALHGAVPNPFNPRTELRFDLPRAQQVRLEIFDVRGRRVATLVDGIEPAGARAVTWSGTDDARRPVPSGVYLVRLKTEEGAKTTKIMLAR